MRPIVFFVFLFFSLAASAQASVDDVIEQIARETGVSKTQNYVPRWRASDSIAGMFERYDSLVSGQRFEFVPREKAYKVIEQFYHIFKSHGHTLYLTNLDFNDSFRSVYDIAILPISNQLEAVKLVGTEAPNHNLSNQQVIEWLEQRTLEFQFEIVVIDHDSLEARFISEPGSYRQLAKEIYEFCPDVIDQGHDKVKYLIKHLRNQKRMWFWWD